MTSQELAAARAALLPRILQGELAAVAEFFALSGGRVIGIEWYDSTVPGHLNVTMTFEDKDWESFTADLAAANALLEPYPPPPTRRSPGTTRTSP